MAEEISIHELAPMGDGVHQSARGRIYVDRALPGDIVEAKVHKAGGLLRGDTTRLVEASPHRVEAPCRHYATCGGCTIQHASEDFYRAWKIGVVRAALEREGLTPEAWLPPVFLPPGQRRRVTFAAVKRKHNVQFGFFQRRTHNVTEITACLVADPAIMGLRKQLASRLPAILQEGKPVDIFIQVVDDQREIVITGPVGQKGRPDLQVYEAAAEIAHAANISRIAWRSREHAEPEILLEVNPLRAKFGALSVALPPLAFLQPTKSGEGALVAAVMNALPKKGRFADLFSGCGTFSGAMLERGTVDAYEVSAAAVNALNKSKGPQPLTVHQRNLFENPLEPDETNRYDAIVFDPPRTGALVQARALASSEAPLIIGVSCNPITLARDARALIDGGCKLKSVQVIDQFVWSYHVELVATFSKAA